MIVYYFYFGIFSIFQSNLLNYDQSESGMCGIASQPSFSYCIIFKYNLLNLTNNATICKKWYDYKNLLYEDIKLEMLMKRF